MKRTTTKLIATTLALSLAIVPLAACSGQDANSTPAGSENTPVVDTSTWTKLSDAIAFGSEPTSASWDENYYVAVFETGADAVRVVAKSEKGIDKKLEKLTPGSNEYPAKLSDAIGNLEIVTAEDISSQKIPQDQLDALAGKTGQELLDSGWTFQSYSMYGGDETCATMENGNFSYNVYFGVKISEKKANSDEDGSAIKEAKVNTVEYFGASNAAVDPTKVELS